ncbi:MAG: DUF3592 domain-containing protein [Tunicatimonas sp.]|uniref:DUF3592 domain-containing protein n=1 Tax=Tunicatimonas sp. TaxID=1940096 RepID=UPI003C764397
MKFTEQLKRIVKVSQFLPIQSFNSLILLIALPILTYKCAKILATDWVETKATPTAFTKIQERIRENEPEYFFKVYYSFDVDEEIFEIIREQGLRLIEEAEQNLMIAQTNKQSIPVWYNKSNPENTELEMEGTNWFIYLFAIGLIILMLAYLRWIMLKYYELEIEEETEPDKAQPQA